MTGRSLLAAVSLSLAAAAAATPALLSTGCARKASAQAAPAASAKTYATRGTIKSFGPDKKFVNIAHEDIPGYMGAMTMSFEPSAPTQLDGLAANDKVSFSFSDDDGRRVLVSIAKAP